VTWIAHATALLDLVNWIAKALHLHGVTNVQIDVDSVRQRAWIELRHWIITIRPRGG
jgi:hypothetical protein